jgi:conjugative transfer signal peptidase TraF
MGIQHRKFVIAVSALAVAAIAAKPCINPVPIVIWNASNSVPIGWYYVAKRQPKLGQIAVIRPPEWVKIYASARGYLPLQTPLLKPVRAVKDSTVCRFGRYVFIDGKLVAKAKYLDTKHRKLPVWKGCRKLKSDEIFVLGMHRDSFDSRYFGPVDRAQVLGTAVRAADLFK